MQVGFPEEAEGVQPSVEAVFYVVCADRFNAEILASCLEQETGAECLIYKDIVDLTFMNNTKIDDQKHLILWDCNGMDVQRLLFQFKSFAKEALSHAYLTLYNVDPGLGIEEKFAWQGLRGFFYRNDPLDHFLKGIKTILKGELWLSRELLTKCILEGKGLKDIFEDQKQILTSRQIEILSMIVMGATNDEIAEELCISTHTVKTHLYNIFRKINVPNRLQAGLWAAENLDCAIPKF